MVDAQLFLTATQISLELDLPVELVREKIVGDTILFRDLIAAGQLQLLERIRLLQPRLSLDAELFVIEKLVNWIDSKLQTMRAGYPYLHAILEQKTNPNRLADLCQMAVEIDESEGDLAVVHYVKMGLVKDGLA